MEFGFDLGYFNTRVVVVMLQYINTKKITHDLFTQYNLKLKQTNTFNISYKISSF